MNIHYIGAFNYNDHVNFASKVNEKKGFFLKYGTIYDIELHYDKNNIILHFDIDQNIYIFITSFFIAVSVFVVPSITAGSIAVKSFLFVSVVRVFVVIFDFVVVDNIKLCLFNKLSVKNLLFLYGLAIGILLVFLVNFTSKLDASSSSSSSKELSSSYSLISFVVSQVSPYGKVT